MCASQANSPEETAHRPPVDDAKAGDIVEVWTAQRPQWNKGTLLQVGRPRGVLEHWVVKFDDPSFSFGRQEQIDFNRDHMRIFVPSVENNVDNRSPTCCQKQR